MIKAHESAAKMENASAVHLKKFWIMCLRLQFSWAIQSAFWGEQQPFGSQSAPRGCIFFARSLRFEACGAMLAMALMFFITEGLAADDLPKKSPGEMLEVEPQLMLNDVSGSPGVLPNNQEFAVPMEADVQRLISRVERAKKDAAWGEHLFKIGVLAKVEAEKRSMQVPKLIKTLEDARLRIAREDVEKERKRFEAGELEKQDLEKAEAVFAAAEASAADAAANWQMAQVQAAELNLSRQRKLVAFGLGRASAVKRAEQQLAALKGEVSIPEEARKALPAVSKSRRGL